jgi:uridine phosphorylase
VWFSGALVLSLPATAVVAAVAHLFVAVVPRPRMAKQPHLLVEAGDVADLALLPGDPGRVERIAGHCENVERVAENREYAVVNATTGGRNVTICSTGIGSPSAAIAVEELARAGVETFLRVGTTGALQSNIDIGDMVVATGAAKDEGTTRRYEADTVPAVPSFEVVRALVDAAETNDEAVHVGPVATDDAFYAETERHVADWEVAGLLAVEMEAAAIFSLARRKGLAAGAICTVDGNLVEGTQKGETDDEELPAKARDNVERAIDLSLAAARSL